MNEVSVSHRKQYWFALILLLLFITGLLAFRGSLVAQDQDPDFSTIDDPLNGQYELFTVDDLVVSTFDVNDSPSGLINNIFYLLTENEAISSESQVTLASPSCIVNKGYNHLKSQQPQFSVAGRFFVLPYDVVVTLAPTADNAYENCDGGTADNMALYVTDAVSGLGTADYPFSFPPYFAGVVMDDFNQDGFADLFMLGETGDGQIVEAAVASAADINDRSQGLVFGPSAQSSGALGTLFDPASADFNADGLLDVAWIGRDFTVYFATVCPGNVAGTMCAGKNEFDILFNPLQSQVNPINLEVDEYSCPPDGTGIAAGHFVNEPGDGLVIFTCEVNTTTGSNAGNVIWYQFNGNFSTEGGGPRDRLDNVVNSNDTFGKLEVQAEAAPLIWLDDLEQVVFAYGIYRTCNYGIGGAQREVVGVITFTSDSMAQKQTEGLKSPCTNGDSSLNWTKGLGVGHFADIADNPNSNAAFNLQFATYLADGHVRIYTTNGPSNYTPELLSNYTLDMGYPNQETSNGPNAMVAGDLQGRSAYLGPPSVLRVSSHSQPSVMLGAPPMHIDYVMPDSTTSSERDVINFSAVPSAFQSQYTMSQSGSNQTADTNTTSYSYTTTEMGEAGFSLKPPYVPSISGKISKTTTDKNDTVNTDYAFEKNEFQYDASTTTGFGDEIWYSDSSFNVYIYRVLGETICPADNQNCSPDEEQPLYVMFSGPNSSGTGPAFGPTIEWYQPLHEPGNIFSYPWDEQQLQFQINNFQLLSATQQFFTDGSTQTQKVGWSESQGQDATAGSTNTHSYDKSYSMTAGKTIGKILDVDISGDIDYNSSTSVQTLNQSTSSMGASQGFEIFKPGSFLDVPLYQYRVEPYILGRTPEAQSVDHPELPETVTTFGPLQATFAANPLAQGSGAWWTGSNNPYQLDFDVALNHPVRWTPDVKAEADSLSCLGTTSESFDCFTFNAPNPDNLWSSEFYWMRGLFVTVNGGSGPLRSQATAGEDVFLSARVYNYSFMDMPSDSKVKVRFYRQEVNGTVPSGNSVLISETEIDPLPGFNSDSSPDTANWATASASFDTTGLDSTYHIFWVVVWAEDSSGNLLSELSGHGLGAKPGTLNTIGDVPLEMVTFNSEQKTFSNNVGYLHSKFYIASAGTQDIPPGDPDLEITNAQATPSQAAPGEKIIISADITSHLAPASAVHVQLFPDAGAWEAFQKDTSMPVPRAFDIELLPHIAEEATDHLEVPYRTSACGTQNILIVARAGVSDEVVTAKASISNDPCIAYFPILPVGTAD